MSQNLRHKEKTKEDKMALIKYVWAPIRIIKTLETEENIVKSLRELSDETKLKVVLGYIKNDLNKIKAIEEFDDKDKALPIKITLSRESFKKFFTGQEENKYQKIGLDPRLTIGIEIESIGSNSSNILYGSEKNGTREHPTKEEVKCGMLLKRRK